MRRTLAKAAVCLALVLAALTSCATTDEAGFTREDYIHAMTVAATTAQTNALSQIYNNVLDGKLLFIPSDLSVLSEKQNDIPGMGTLIDIWKEVASKPVMELFEEFRALTDGMIGRTEYANAAVSAVSMSDTSATDTLMMLYGSEVRAFVAKAYAEVSTQALKDCIVQYNTWLRVQYLMTGKSVGTTLDIPTDEAIMDSVVDHVVKVYFQALANAEELYRTTPDPYADETAARVFGLM